MPDIKPNIAAQPNSARKHRVRRWLPWAGAILLVSLLVAGFWPRPLTVETTRLVKGAMRDTVNEEGKTRIKQRFVVSAPVSGQLRRIPFKAGATVKAGETVLAVIDPPTPPLLDLRSRALAEARLDAAAAALEKARANHHFQTNELNRLTRLYKENTITIQELETAQNRETAAARDTAVAEGAFRQAEAELAVFSAGTTPGAAPTEIKSPITGQVLRVFEESSRLLVSGTPLLEVGDPTDLEVVIEVLSRDGATIAPGTKVLLEHWGGKVPLEGRVRLVEPAAFTKVSALGVEEQRVRVIADLLTTPDQRPSLGDAFRVEARIVVWEAEQVLKIPTGALFRRGQDWAAFTLENGRARLQIIKIGHSSDTEAQVLDGLQENDEVILYPGDRIKDGQKIAIIKV